MRALRVIFVIRPDSGSRMGGDVVQAVQTARELRALGHQVEVAATAEPDARGFDLAHVFGVFDPPVAELQIAACKRAGVPVALSPIWWDLTEYFVRSRAIEKALMLREAGVERRLRHVRERSVQQLMSRRERAAALRRKARQRELMQCADVLLPNSITEAHRYVSELNLQHSRVHVVPNAVEAEVFAAEPEYGARGGVLCAARVESKKNQALMLYALRDCDVEITLAGECYDAYYRRLCERWGKRVTFTGALERTEIFALMRKALVHVLPGWAETPGIASLEAAKAGCAIVSGNRASEFEYLRGEAWYCDPGDERSIRDAVLGALDSARSRPDLTLRRRLCGLTWEQAARATLEGYAQVV